MLLFGKSLLWNDNPEQICCKAKTLVQQTIADYNNLLTIPVDQINFDNTIRAINSIDYKYSSVRSKYLFRDILDFHRYVHPEKPIRDASIIASKVLLDFDIESYAKQEIFNRAYYVQQQINQNLSSEHQSILQRVIAFGKHNGLHLSSSFQSKIRNIEKRILQICAKFQENLIKKELYLSVTAEDLDGMPEDFIDSLETDGPNHFKLFLNYGLYLPIMTRCHQAYTRKAMEVTFHSRCKLENKALVVELINLRHKKAKLLGFGSHVSYVVNQNMAKYADEVEQFLTQLTDRLQPLGSQIVKTMLQFKRAESDAEVNQIDDEKINMWDLRYYSTKLDELNYSIDKEKLKEYFPVDAVIKGLFKLIEELFELRFEEVVKANVWHNDVTMYNVSDLFKENLIGQLYIDLIHRPGKYPHLTSFCLIPGCTMGDGTRQNAVTALIGDFFKLPDGDGPLLTHDEVQTMFYEFGSILQFLCSENETLLPLETIELLATSRNSNRVIFYLKQIILAMLDLTLHTNPSVEIDKAYSSLCQQILGISASKNTFMPATFVHLINGYDANYYSYLWSRVYSFDMFHTRFKGEGIMNPQIWREFREKILAPAGSVDARSKFYHFMGRKPRVTAFVEFLLMDDSDLSDYLYQKPSSVFNFSDSSLQAASSHFSNVLLPVPQNSESVVLAQTSQLETEPNQSGSPKSVPKELPVQPDSSQSEDNLQVDSRNSETEMVEQTPESETRPKVGGASEIISKHPTVQANFLLLEDHLRDVAMPRNSESVELNQTPRVESQPTEITSAASMSKPITASIVHLPVPAENDSQDKLDV